MKDGQYEITFRDRKTMLIDGERGDKIKQMWVADSKDDTPVDVDGFTFLISDIKRMEFFPRSAPVTNQMPAHTPTKIEKCRGERSIQREIHAIIEAEYPRTWHKKVQSKKVREEIRATLRASGQQWCDWRENECACKFAVMV